MVGDGARVGGKSRTLLRLCVVVSTESPDAHERAASVPTARPQRVRRVALAVVVGLVCALAVPVVAAASSAEDLRAEARRITAQINANGDQIAALGERYNGAVLHLQQIHDLQRRAVSSLAAAVQHSTALRSLKARVAARRYVAGSASGGEPLILSDAGASILATAAQNVYAQAVAARDNQLLDRYRRAQGELRAQQRHLDALEATAQQEADALASTRRGIETANATARSLLAKVNGRLGVLVRQEQLRQQRQAEAAARARAAADAARAARRSAALPSRPAAGPATNLPNVPPPSSGAAAAIAFARAQIGKPYVWGSTGPNSFDCSGLTMRAWEAGGVSMPHYSGAQFSTFPHVGLSQLQPGDLVFKGPGGSAHVALYVGGGMQIAATHTGSYVLLQPVDYSHLSGAVRP